MFWPLLPEGAERPGAAASPAGWPPPQHGAVARRRRATAPQNTTDSHSETLCIELVLEGQALLGGAGSGVRDAGDSAGEVGLTASFYGEAHGGSHLHRMYSFSYGGIY
jgi:hypothetical protein